MKRITHWAALAATGLIVLATAVMVDLLRPCPTATSESCTWYHDLDGHDRGDRYTDVGGLVIIKWR
jgi:hypothetical protein